jgi:hypothetical protein
LKLKDKYIGLADKAMSINSAFVVFRSMEGKERVQLAYKQYESRRRCCGCNIRCCESEQTKELYFGKKMLKV